MVFKKFDYKICLSIQTNHPTNPCPGRMFPSLMLTVIRDNLLNDVLSSCCPEMFSKLPGLFDRQFPRNNSIKREAGKSLKYFLFSVVGLTNTNLFICLFF